MFIDNCMICGTKHNKDTNCLCPECGENSVVDSNGGISGDFYINGQLTGIDLSEVKCEKCGFSWHW